MNFDWSPELVNMLRDLRERQNKTFTQCAAEINDKFGVRITRNAAIGAASRTGIKGSKDHNPHTQKDRLTRKSARRKAMRAAQRVVLEAVFVERRESTDLPPDQSPCAVALMQLTASACRWPLGEPGPEMLYCGAVPNSGSSYCDRHHQMAHAKPRSMNLNDMERQRRVFQARTNFASMGRPA